MISKWDVCESSECYAAPEMQDAPRIKVNFKKKKREIITGRKKYSNYTDPLLLLEQVWFLQRPKKWGMKKTFLLVFADFLWRPWNFENVIININPSFRNESEAHVTVSSHWRAIHVYFENNHNHNNVIGLRSLHWSLRHHKTIQNSCKKGYSLVTDAGMY